ncbi:MAG TPA: DUF1214 domain-containing protein [Chthoniobacterales bacterium]
MGSSAAGPLVFDGLDLLIRKMLKRRTGRDGGGFCAGIMQLDARQWYFYGVTGITPAMAIRVTGIGSQYLFASLDADKNYFDGAKTYKVALPKGIPHANFWSLTLYDNMTRSMFDTPQRYPRAGSPSYPSPAAEASADGSTTIYVWPHFWAVV